MMLENVTGKFWDKKRKWGFAFLLAVVLSLSVWQGSAWAEVTHNETLLDESSDDLLNSDGNAADVDDYGLTYITDTLRYSSEKDMYVYSLSDFSVNNIYTNVCDGMTVNDTVVIEADEGITTVLYEDDEEVEDADFSDISEPGRYSVYASNANSGQSEIFSFTVVGSVSNIYNYSLPSNFTVTSAIYNGEDAEYYYSSVDTTEEGEYLISYSCTPTGLSGTFRVTIDHTAPTLKLEGVKDGKAHHAVDLSDLEDGASIYITKDGSSIDPQTKLVDYGRYKVTVVDEAGNQTEYSFKILVYFTTGTILFVIVFIIVAAGIAFYIWYSKNHFRVR